MAGRDRRQQLARVGVPAPDAFGGFFAKVVVRSTIRQHLDWRSIRSRVLVDARTQVQPARKVPPFPTTQGRRRAAQVASCHVDLCVFERVTRAQHAGGVGLAQGVCFRDARDPFGLFGFLFPSLRPLLLALGDPCGRIRSASRTRRSGRQPRADHHTQHQSQPNRPRRREDQLVPPKTLLQPVTHARWPGQHRVVPQVPLDVHRHFVGGLVPPGPVLLQALHCDPVQVGFERCFRLSAG